MEGGWALLSIVAIIAIVVIAAGIIAVIANMIMGAFGNDKKAESQPKTTEYVKEDSKEETVSNDAESEYDFEAINSAKAEEEQRLTEQPEEVQPEEQAEEQPEEEDLDKLEESLANQAQENEEESDDDADLDDLLEGITNDIVDEEKEKQTEVKSDSELDQYNIDDFLKEDEAEQEEAEQDEAEPVEAEEEVEAEEVKAEPVEEKVDNSEVEALKAQLAEANRQLEEARTSVKVTTTEQDCLDRLAILEERLKNAKSELRTNAKEYRPLKKVYNEYDRNLAKYRRKNAQVAKMKTDLYGVNNYVDLDKEEAQKLANEIDVLDGLRLSINHCEQVINESKDRFPILEHTNKILTEQIAEIEQDIERYKAILAKIKEEQGEGEGEGDNQ